MPQSMEVSATTFGLDQTSTRPTQRGANSAHAKDASACSGTANGLHRCGEPKHISRRRDGDSGSWKIWGNTLDGETGRRWSVYGRSKGGEATRATGTTKREIEQGFSRSLLSVLQRCGPTDLRFMGAPQHSCGEIHTVIRPTRTRAATLAVFAASYSTGPVYDLAIR